MTARRRSAFASLRWALAPPGEWLTALLLWACLLSVVWALERADWVDTPPLALTATAGLLTGLLASRYPGHPWRAHLAGLLLGGALVYLQASAMAQGPDLPTRLAEVYLRMSLWARALAGRAISTDLLPFGLALALATWGVAYLSAWGVFRRRNPWWALLPMGVGLLTALSYLPASYFFHFLVFLGPASLLAVRLASQGVQRWWEGLGVRARGYSGAVTGHALWMVALATLVVSLAPLPSPAWETLRSGWERFRSPLESLEGELGRLFAGVPSYKATPLRPFGQFLALQGRAYLSEEPVFIGRTPVPLYWRTTVYTRYTSKGWTLGETVARPTGWEPDYPLENTTLRYAEVEFWVEARTSSPVLFLPGQPVHITRPYAVAFPRPTSYTLDLKDPSRNQGLPPELQALARRLQGLGEGESAGALESALPPGLAVARVHKEAGGREVVYPVAGGDAYSASLRRALSAPGNLTALEVVERVPYPPDPVAVLARGRLQPGQGYSGRVSIPLAGEEELRRAGRDYPPWVARHYLQLPPDLPPAVTQLARQLAQGADNPYDAALAVEGYLRTHYTYTTQVDPPPLDADAVAYFLFTSRKGDDDHFASAMAVMLRSLGIPARLASGFAPGVWSDELKAYLVRARDLHSWPEVYFPGYGWVGFEPTPVFPRRPRGSLVLRVPTPGAIPPQALHATATREDLPQQAEKRSRPQERSGRRPGGYGLLPPPLFFLGSPLGLAGLLFFLALGLLALGAWALWRALVVPLPRPELAYLKVARLGSLLGMGPRPHQTPLEYCLGLAQALPWVRGDLLAIAHAFGQSRYARRALPPREREALVRAWARVRRALLEGWLQGV